MHTRNCRKTLLIGKKNFWVLGLLDYGSTLISMRIRIQRQQQILDPDQCFGSGFHPDWTQSRRTKMTHKNLKKLRNFMFWSAGCSLLRAEGCFCSLDVLYGGLGIGIWQFLMKKYFLFFSCKFITIFGHQNPGSGLLFSLKCWIRIWIKWIRIRTLILIPRGSESRTPARKHEFFSDFI